MDITLILSAIGLGLSILLPLLAFYKKRKELGNYYSLIWKNSKRLKAKDLLGERPYMDFYLDRDIDNSIFRAIERRRNFLIVGPPLSGKTRAVFNSLKKFKRSVLILVPRSVSMPVFSIPAGYRFWKKKLIFVDDLQYYIEKQDNFHLLFREAKKRNIPVIAACHSGREFKKVKNKLVEQNLDIDTIFGDDFVELQKITGQQGKNVAESLGIEWDNVKFNGTVGSIFMRLSEMERRFENSDNIEKTILRSLRNLYLCGIYDDNSIFRIEWVKKTAQGFELDGRDFEWSGWLRSLEDKEFIRVLRKNKLWAEDAYLSYVVKSEVEVTQFELFEDMNAVFENDTEVLQMAGERAFDIGIVDVNVAEYMKTAISAFERILELLRDTPESAEYIKAQNYLGHAYWSLAKVQDTMENCRKSISCFNETLKHITIESNPHEYALIKNRIGNTYTAYAEVENKEENCLTAISAYHEALKVFKISANPQEYARAQNNLGGAYLILAEVRDSRENYKKAVSAFNEALKVRTAAEYPKYFALTKNNIGNTYARLADIEGPEENLKKAIEAYEDILKIHSKDKSPLQYGLTMNNIGNAYALLAVIKDKKENCEKAIDAFERSLEVRRPDQLPVQYANTMFNLGDAYLVQSEINDDPAIIDKAVNSFEEALILRPKEKYPYQHSEVKFGLGRAYIKLAAIEDKTENYHKGIRALDEALSFFTEEAYPKFHELISQEIIKAKKIFFV